MYANNPSAQIRNLLDAAHATEAIRPTQPLDRSYLRDCSPTDVALRLSQNNCLTRFQIESILRLGITEKVPSSDCEKDYGIPLMFDGHCIQDQIGSGNYAGIYSGIHINSRTLRAVKVFNKPTDQTTKERITREINFLIQNQNKRIVRGHEWGILEDGRRYLSMDLVDGKSLQSIIASDGRMNWDKAFYVCCEIARALSVLHKSDIYHRDLSPGNILLTEQNEVVLIDFGKSRFSDMERITYDNEPIITPAYASPEAVHNAHNMGEHLDKHNLASILFVLIWGSEPFPPKSEDLIQYVLNKRGRYFPSLEDHRYLGVPKGTDDVLRRMINPDDETPIEEFANELVSLASASDISLNAFRPVGSQIDLTPVPTKALIETTPNSDSESETLDENKLARWRKKTPTSKRKKPKPDPYVPRYSTREATKRFNRMQRILFLCEANLFGISVCGMVYMAVVAYGLASGMSCEEIVKLNSSAEVAIAWVVMFASFFARFLIARKPSLSDKSHSSSDWRATNR